MNIDNQIKGLFLLILAVSGEFISETLGCKTQKLLRDNMIIKNIFIIFVLFFAISYTETEVINPLVNFKKSLIIWVFYVLFTRMTLSFTLIAFLILFIIYLIGLYEVYYTKNKINKDKLEIMKKVKPILINLLMGILIVGFVFYLNKQYREKKNFSLNKFIFGVRQCDSLK
jgi:hypothetical protein